jgi:glycosyltransferase involved in cell wall biosynthesis
LLVKPGSTEQLAQAIDRLYRDRELAAAMGCNNRADIERYFAGPNSELYLNAFRELAGSAAVAAARVPLTR